MPCKGRSTYTLFGGEVERKVMNAMGYDAYRFSATTSLTQGMEQLARWKQLSAVRLSISYDFSESTLRRPFVPSMMKRSATRPWASSASILIRRGVTPSRNYTGHQIHRRRKRLPTKGRPPGSRKTAPYGDCPVIHIGYDRRPATATRRIARNSHDIDVVIGGHSRTVIGQPTSAPECPPGSGKCRRRYYQCAADRDRSGEPRRDRHQP